MHGGGGRRGGHGYDAIREKTLVFSADGKRVAYRAWKGATQMVVVDGEGNAAYGAIAEGPPIFSADSKHVAYRAWKGPKQVMMVDGQEYEGGEYDRVGKEGPIFHPDGVLEYLAIKDDALYRVEDIPVP